MTTTERAFVTRERLSFLQNLLLHAILMKDADANKELRLKLIKVLAWSCLEGCKIRNEKNELLPVHIAMTTSNISEAAILLLAQLWPECLGSQNV